MPHTALPNADIAVLDNATDNDNDVVADFVTAAGTWPHRTAVVHNGTAITYHELLERVRQTALRYRTHRSAGAGSSGLIGAMVSRTPELVTHLFGILQAGAAYCPIDAALPAARKQVLAATLGLDRLYATSDNPYEPMHLRIEELEQAADPAHTRQPQPVWAASDRAYVLCTSGSTGTPKPVAISREALTVTVRALRVLFALTPDDRVLQFASLGWDTCLEEILPALTGGSALIFDDAAHTGSFAPFLRMLAEREVTVLDLPTAFWHELVLFLREEQAPLPDCVRLVVIGGERVDPTRLQQWRDLDTRNIRLLNTYGCTETTMITHAVQLSGPGTEPQIANRDAEAPLGRPLPHVRDHLTDAGELLVAGPSLAIGYLGLPQTTETAFPVADYGCGAARWFCTGDLVVRGEGDLLYSRGRADEQLKVSGVRVHPAEVEAQLNAHPAVAGAAVVGERLLERTSLTAYVVPARATTPTELKRYLRDRLPSQFIPSRIKFVASLTFTASGKVDRAATHRAAAAYDRNGAGQ